MMDEIITVVKTYPAISAGLVVVGFVLGALHHYFGM